VALLLSEMYDDVVLTPFSKDFGPDVVASRQRSGYAEKAVVSCKQSQTKVGPEEIDRVSGIVSRERATRGLVVAPGGFTSREAGSPVSDRGATPGDRVA